MSPAPLLLLLCVLLLQVVTAVLGSASASDACPSYDASKIRLVTFDCFAAMMAWEDSMFDNVAEILPDLSSSQVDSLVRQWESAYGSASGTLFEEKITGAFPFSWHVSTELDKILRQMQINVTRNQFSDLVNAWGDLIPWTNTQSTLEAISAANITVGVLSNGDRYTLERAVSYFSTVSFAYVFPSDFPAGAFKPQHFIYDQAKEVGFSIDEILHVAGGGKDASGARDAGLFSVLTSSVSGQSSAVLHDRFVGGTTPCFEVGDISEVLDVLEL